MFVCPVGTHKIESVLDDNMIIADNDVIWLNNDWWYNIIGKANRTDEKHLRMHNSKQTEN